MKVWLNEITGIADSIIALYLPRRSWSKTKEDHIRSLVRNVCDEVGRYIPNIADDESSYMMPYDNEIEEYNRELGKVIKYGLNDAHITLLRFIDFSITVEGLHRAGRDDWDSHAKRFENRIIRSSTRNDKVVNKLSNYYDGKVLTTDMAVKHLGIDLPESFTTEDGILYVKTDNGYIRSDLENNADVRRGLYPMGISSNFIFKVNLCEWCHVYKERGEHGGAHPEVKECCEMIADQIEKFQPMFTRDLFLRVKN